MKEEWRSRIRKVNGKWRTSCGYCGHKRFLEYASYSLALFKTLQHIEYDH